MTALTPREVFARFEEALLTGSVDDVAELNAEDVIVEWPFNPPGRPRRIQGRAEMLALATAGRASLPVRFEEFRNVVVHETADPEVIVVEYEMVGRLTATGRTAAAGFVQVLRVRDGKVVHLREYQDVLAMSAALRS